jgi:hypothetical protein
MNQIPNNIMNPIPKDVFQRLHAIPRDIEREKKLVQIVFHRSCYHKPAKAMMNLGVDIDLYPSLTKISKDVNFNKLVWRSYFNSLVGKITPELIKAQIYDTQKYALENQINDTIRSVLMYVSASMKNEEMEKLAQIARICIGDEYNVIVVNGNYTTNRESERFVRGEINRATKIDGKRGVWIIASNMCQRSFSIPEINVILIAYDGGEVGPLIQKISRVSTIGANKTVGHVVTLSIDGQRDTRLFDIVAETAKKYANNHQCDFETALKRVVPTFPFLDLDENGHQIQLSVDDYCREIFNSSSSHYLIVNKERILTVDIMNPESKTVEILADLDIKLSQKLKCANDLKKGKTFIDTGSKEHAKIEKMKKNLHDQLKEKLNQISSKMHYLAEATLTNSFDDAISTLKTNPELELDFLSELGVGADDLNTFVIEGFTEKYIIEAHMKDWNDRQNSSWNLIK